MAYKGSANQQSIFVFLFQESQINYKKNTNFEKFFRLSYFSVMHVVVSLISGWQFENQPAEAAIFVINLT